MSRIALFHPSFAVSGGAEFLIASQAQALQADGHDLRLVTGGFDAGRWEALLAGIPVATFQKTRHLMDLVMPWDRVGKVKRRSQAALTHLADREIVLAYNYPSSNMLGYLDPPCRKLWQCNEPPRGIHLREANPVLSARVADCGNGYSEDATAAFAARLRSFESSRSKKTVLRGRRDFDIQTVARLDEIFAISEFSRDNAKAIYGRCSDTVVYPVVRFPEGGHQRHGLDRSGLKVLVHSRLEVLKNIDTVIRGFAQFRDQGCPGAELHVVGEGEHRSRLERLAKETLGEKGWHFHGFLPDAELRAVYEACDVFALLPLDEPFGMVFPEAAAKGLLLVGPDHGGPLEILDGGRLGRVCDPFDIEALADAFSAIWAMDDVAVERQRSMAAEACHSRYSEAAVMPMLRSILEGRS
ncbi:MAG: glycosyltransferase family 4 protein [Geothrix sp.]|nr:glycosyltransferase family 4 protein [Geothrix sp.]